MNFIKLSILFCLAISLSIDDLVVGAAFGLRKTKITIKSMALITLGSTVSMFLSMNLGNLMLTLFAAPIPEYASAFFLAVLGGHYIYRARAGSNQNHLLEKNSFAKWTAAIQNWEALYIGIALGVDDFTEALALAMAGFPIFLTVFLSKLVEIMMFVAGAKLGVNGSAKLTNGKFGLIPGVVLILVALWQL